MSKYIFPAIFHPEEEGGYSICFPDLEGCFTQGNSVAEGLAMAEDVLPLMLTAYEDSRREIPSPSAINDLQIEAEDFATLVSCDTTVYRRLMDNMAVKRTLPVPQWMNQAAVAAGVLPVREIVNAGKASSSPAAQNSKNCEVSP